MGRNRRGFPTGQDGPPTRLYLVRHGEVDGQGELHGHVDVGLTDRGRAQMDAVAARLERENLAAVYSSDLLRARWGAERIAGGRVPVEADVSFRELHMGRWDGRRFHEVWKEDGTLVEAWWADLEGFVVPEGESLAQLRRRVLPALAAVLERHAGETVCLVAHGGVNRVVLFEAMGLALRRFHSVAQDYGCLNLIEYHPDGNCLVRLVNG